MAVDYDLVILGGTAYARMAALQAAGYGARVALVEAPGLFEQQQQQKYLLQGLQQIGETWQRQTVGERFGLVRGGKLDWQAVLSWSAIAAETQQAQLSVASMSAQGVDVVLEAPQRLTRCLTTITSSRRLSARSVLAAYGELPTALETLQSAQQLPPAISVMGASPEAIEWALALSDCGIAVTLVAERVLPYEDSDIRRLIQLQIAALGIRSYTDADYREKAVPQEASIAIEMNRPALELPSFVSLRKNKSDASKPEEDKRERNKGEGNKREENKAAENKLSANRRLQTNHPRVFACGSALGGSASEELARYEIAIALNNALFLPTAKTSYETVPQRYSWFARVGLTESQAKHRYGSAVQISASSRADTTCLTRLNPLISYHKLIYANNRLVGAHSIGNKAASLVQQLALRIRQPARNGNILAETIFTELSPTQQSNRLHPNWQPEHWQPGHWRRDWAENWFNWQRSRYRR